MYYYPKLELHQIFKSVISKYQARTKPAPFWFFFVFGPARGPARQPPLVHIILGLFINFVVFTDMWESFRKIAQSLLIALMYANSLRTKVKIYIWRPVNKTVSVLYVQRLWLLSAWGLPGCHFLNIFASQESRKNKCQVPKCFGQCATNGTLSKFEKHWCTVLVILVATTQSIKLCTLILVQPQLALIMMRVYEYMIHRKLHQILYGGCCFCHFYHWHIEAHCCNPMVW